MSDAFYKFVRFIGRHAFWVSSRPVVLNREVTRRPGAYILAANHQCAYDVPLLIRHCSRPIDFVSIVEVFRNPLVGWFYGLMNAFPLDRSRPDSPTVRIIFDRLAHGRAVGMFPEGRFRVGAQSVVHTGQMRSGIGRLATRAGAPVIPCVIVGSAAYSRFASWLPLRRTRYGIAFGYPILPTTPAEQIETELVAQFQQLHQQLADLHHLAIPRD